MSFKLPYTNADTKSKRIIHFDLGPGPSQIILSFNKYAGHVLQSMSTSAKLLFGSIASCINGIIPCAFKYTAVSVCLSIIEDDLQNNRMPLPVIRHQLPLNDVIITFDEEKIE
jgi:hypothetical protein